MAGRRRSSGLPICDREIVKIFLRKKLCLSWSVAEDDRQGSGRIVFVFVQFFKVESCVNIVEL